VISLPEVVINEWDGNIAVGVGRFAMAENEDDITDGMVTEGRSVVETSGFCSHLEPWKPCKQ